MSEDQSKPTETVNMELPTRLEVVGLEEYENAAGEKKTFSTRIGSLFVNKARTGFNLDLAYLPRKADVHVIAMPPSPKGDGKGRG